MSYTFIRYEKAGRLAYLTLNRPEKRNALHGGMVGELISALGKAADDSLVKIIVLRAAGSVFSAGADLGYLEQLKRNTYEENLADSRQLMTLFTALYRHPKLVIAQVEGDAIAGGCGLATVCDLCYAVPEARFGYTEVGIGFVPALVSVFLISKVGDSRARELLLTAKRITAEQAAAIGLITAVKPKEELADWVQKEAEALCAKVSGTSVTLTKELLVDIRGLSLEEALDRASIANSRARATPDCQKGIRAFLEKRKIQW